MDRTDPGVLGAVLREERDALLTGWIARLKEDSATRMDLLSEAELRQQATEFLDLLTAAVQQGGTGPGDAAFAPLREMLARISRSRALQGFSPVETAGFVFSIKQPLFEAVRRREAADATAAAWAMTLLLDGLGLYTTEVYQRSREDVIRRQQSELLELSTPVVKLWDGILALPLIGTLDSERTQVVMESLLQRIVETGSEVAIIDITGVPTVDTLVAQHLIKTVAAARLMGVECIISGIRPQIAQTIVHLGVDLGTVVTKASLADAFRVALRSLGRVVAAAPAGALGAASIARG